MNTIDSADGLPLQRAAGQIYNIMEKKTIHISSVMIQRWDGFVFLGVFLVHENTHSTSWFAWQLNLSVPSVLHILRFKIPTVYYFKWPHSKELSLYSVTPQQITIPEPLSSSAFLSHLCLAGMCLFTTPWPTTGLNINIQAAFSTVKVTLHHPKQPILTEVTRRVALQSLIIPWATEKESSGWFENDGTQSQLVSDRLTGAKHHFGPTWLLANMGNGINKVQYQISTKYF